MLWAMEREVERESVTETLEEKTIFNRTAKMQIS